MALLFRLLLVAITLLNNITLLITLSNLYVAQVSSSFKCLEIQYTTPTFVTKVLHLDTYIKLTVTAKVKTYTAICNLSTQ